MTAIFSLTGTYSHEGGYETDKEKGERRNSNSNDSKYKGVSLRSEFGNFSCGRVKRKTRATSYFGQSQNWGVNQQLLYRLSRIQLQHPPRVPKRTGSHPTLTRGDRPQAAGRSLPTAGC